MTEDLAAVYGWPPSELDALEAAELVAWHAAAGAGAAGAAVSQPPQQPGEQRHQGDDGELRDGDNIFEQAHRVTLSGSAARVSAASALRH